MEVGALLSGGQEGGKERRKSGEKKEQEEGEEEEEEARRLCIGSIICGEGTRARPADNGGLTSGSYLMLSGKVHHGVVISCLLMLRTLLLIRMRRKKAVYEPTSSAVIGSRN